MKWEDAIKVELKALEKIKLMCWLGKKLVGCRQVFTMKYKFDISMERLQGKLDAESNTQTNGIDYLDTFAPVRKMNINTSSTIITN